MKGVMYLNVCWLMFLMLIITFTMIVSLQLALFIKPESLNPLKMTLLRGLFCLRLTLIQGLFFCAYKRLLVFVLVTLSIIYMSNCFEVDKLVHFLFFVHFSLLHVGVHHWNLLMRRCLGAFTPQHSCMNAEDLDHRSVFYAQDYKKAGWYIQR